MRQVQKCPGKGKILTLQVIPDLLLQEVLQDHPKCELVFVESKTPVAGTSVNHCGHWGAHRFEALGALDDDV